mgnify:FL=1
MKFLIVFIFLLLVSCSDSSQEVKDYKIKDSSEYVQSKDYNVDRNVYFGDTHVHTKYSFDAFIFGTTNSPDDAYKYAKGGTIQHPLGFDMTLREPLDFYAVTDHGFFMGMMDGWANPNSRAGKHPAAKPFHNLNRKENLTVESGLERITFFRDQVRSGAGAQLGGWFSLLKAYLTNNNSLAVDAFDYETHKSAWSDVAKAAEEHNDPGKFTTFIAYEYTASTNIDNENLHRNVIFRTSKAPVRPYSRIDSLNPEDLWNTMDKWREKGIDSLAIPHNSNGSNGRMFEMHKSNGEAIDKEYSSQRMRNEPIVEVTQVKGTSDTHPILSPNDEWADFEIMNSRVGSVPPTYSGPDGSYVRDALLKGLTLEQLDRGNPYTFGLIGSSDTHTAASSFDESNYFSKVGILDGIPQGRGSVGLSEEQLDIFINVPEDQRIFRYSEEQGEKYLETGFSQWSASGIAAVWAEENTRESIFSSFKRKETYATTGNRILLRFFGGFNLSEMDINSSSLIGELYDKGVPMGGNLINSNDDIPNFIVWAKKASNGANLQRVQIIKGWVDKWSSEPSEKVYDVICSDGLQVDPATNRCPDNGAKVNISDCSITDNVGSEELKILWSDPEFDPEVKAFYYVRVLENPTCRWSTWDAIRAGSSPRPELKPTIQERAWSSPIWYIPSK